MSTDRSPIYKRIILKISGEALAGPQEYGIDFAILHYLSEEILPVVNLGIEVGLVIGGGNFFRGASLREDEVKRITGDHMGMVATVLNALAMRDVLEHHSMVCEIMSAVPFPGIVRSYSQREALHCLRNKQVVIFAGGTGNPLVTTDFALSLRGIELGADLLLKATNVDGIYTSDPRFDSNATRYQRVTYAEVVEKELGVMDLGAFCQCRDHNMKLRVFNLRKHGALLNIVLGEDEGTLVE